MYIVHIFWHTSHSESRDLEDAKFIATITSY